MALAPQASGPRCGTSILDYNRAVTEAAAEDLHRARGFLADASYQVLAASEDGALPRFAAAGGFDLILLPARRRLIGAPWHPYAERLRADTAADVHVVG